MGARCDTAQHETIFTLFGATSRICYCCLPVCVRKRESRLLLYTSPVVRKRRNKNAQDVCQYCKRVVLGASCLMRLLLICGKCAIYQCIIVLVNGRMKKYH